MPVVFSRLRVAKSGNLVLRSYYGLGGKWSDAVVLNTKGLGDRRARKVAARLEMERRTRTYGSMTWFVSGPATVRRVEATITIKL